MFRIFMSSYGLSVLGCVLVSEICWATSMPFVSRPNTVCLLSSHGYKENDIMWLDIHLLTHKLTVATTVMKNWEPLVLGPALAMLTTKGLSCLSIGCNSSSNSPPQMDSPPVPVPAVVCCVAAGERSTSLMSNIRTCWVSSLDHELFYNTMKYVAIEVAITGMHTEVFHCLWAAMCMCM